MRIDIEYTDIVFLRNILKDKDELYRKQLVSGYTDDSTPIDTISVIESEQKRVSKLFQKLNQY
jgi:hypothetical protein